MSAYDLEEQEQLAALKAWWKENGNLVLTALTLALLVVAAWNGWTWYQRTNSAQAAGIYETLQQAARSGDIKAARDSAGAILEKYSRTSYAPLAALVSAKVHFQAGDLKTARAQLEWVVANAGQDELRAIARLRLASVLSDDNEPEAALKILESGPAVGFEGLYAEARGDILYAQKKTFEARAAYLDAVARADGKDGAQRESLRQKLDAIGGK
jgi:predicted negative regulator of RcsB-dependent stress response